MFNTIVSQNNNQNSESSEEEWVPSDRDQESSEGEELKDATIDTEENDVQGTREGKRQRRKHRLSDPLQWEYNRNKKKREYGDFYFGRKDNAFTVRKEKRNLKTRCLCKIKNGLNSQCFRLSEEERTCIITKFCKMTWTEKKCK